MSSQRIIELTEWEKAKKITFSPDEARMLHRVESRLDVRWSGANEAAISGKSGYVGIVSLSDETQIIVHPHIPIASVLELACYAYELQPPKKALIEEARLDDTGPADWLAFLLTLEVEKLLSIGLRQGYREVEETIPYIRGRIDFRSLRWGESKPGLVPCLFEEFVMDTLENRILRGSLELLASFPLSNSSRKRLRSALTAFSQVKLMRPSTTMFSRVAVTRMNSYYEPSLLLCQLVLDSAGIELDTGKVATPGFFFSMADVFEKAIERALREEFGAQNVHSQAEYKDRIKFIDGAPMIPVTFIPDNVLGPRDTPWLIVDAKYKNPLVYNYGDRLRNTDLYQALTYAVALDAPVVLVYPRLEQNVDVVLRTSDYETRIITIDLYEQGLTDTFSDWVHEKLLSLL